MSLSPCESKKKETNKKKDLTGFRFITSILTEWCIVYQTTHTEIITGEQLSSKASIQETLALAGKSQSWDCCYGGSLGQSADEDRLDCQLHHHKPSQNKDRHPWISLFSYYWSQCWHFKQQNSACVLWRKDSSTFVCSTTPLISNLGMTSWKLGFLWNLYCAIGAVYQNMTLRYSIIHESSHSLTATSIHVLLFVPRKTTLKQ